MTFGELKENKCYTIKSEEFGTIELNICKLNKGEYSSGINNLTDLKWVAYRIDWTKSQNVPEQWRMYNEIIFSPYRIDEKGRQEASQRIVLKRVTMIEDRKHYHIDGNSGNIHPPFQSAYDFNSAPIQQLVLVIGLGPKCNKLPEDEPHYDYYKNPEKKTGKCRVPKAAYYPIINEQDSEIEEIKKSFGYQFLKKIWEEIHK